MNPMTISIAIVISAITLVAAAAIAVNYSPTPAHAVKNTCKFVAEPHHCFSNRHDCEQYANSVGVTCNKL
jgi:hypothetical protein